MQLWILQESESHSILSAHFSRSVVLPLPALSPLVLSSRPTVPAVAVHDFHVAEVKVSHFRSALPPALAPVSPTAPSIGPAAPTTAAPSAKSRSQPPVLSVGPVCQSWKRR
jgi:hypothetical protein